MTLFSFSLGTLAFLLLASVLLFLRLLLGLLLSLHIFFALALYLSGLRLQVERPLILVLCLVILVLNFEAHILITLKVAQNLTEQLVCDSVCQGLVEIATGARADLGTGRFFLL